MKILFSSSAVETLSNQQGSRPLKAAMSAYDPKRTLALERDYAI